MVNISDMLWLNQHIETEIPHGSRDQVIARNTVKMMFNLDTALTDKTGSIVNTLGRALVKTKY